MNALIMRTLVLLLIRPLLLCAVVLACGAVTSLAQSPPALLIESSTGSQFRLSWTQTPGFIVLEEADALSEWRPFPQIPTLSNGRFSVMVDKAGFSRRFFRLHSIQTDGLPPDPASIAPPIPPGVATPLAGATEFLYTGPTAIQTGVVPGTIQAGRAAVLRGKVTRRDETPLSSVTVSILNHPELGQTISRADGMFDLAVNGGGLLTVNYRRNGFVSAQRQVQAPWQNFVTAPDVTLIPLDTKVTAVDLTAAEPVQVAQGAPVTDADGTRKATVLIPQGTTAEMVMPDGSTHAVTSLSIRATEFTVGPKGPQAMPGDLPPTSAYTYAVDLCADEALAAGAVDVRFNPPLPFYVENFLGFAAGIDVPLGSYDPARGIWVPSNNGRVIRILGVTDGIASMDVTGDGLADSGTALAALSITDAERQKLATLYVPGQSLWRVLIPHFSEWDTNWPLVPPDDAVLPGEDPEHDEPLCEPCMQAGNSIIECQNQFLGEALGVVGTGLELHYQSDRTRGYRVPYTLQIPVKGPVAPQGFGLIVVEVEVAGRYTKRYFAANEAQFMTFIWDGRDAYGRTLDGPQPVTVRIGYTYAGQYAQTSKFGLPGNGQITTVPSRMQVTLWRAWTDWIGTWHAPSDGLGGWSLNAHHSFMTNTKFLFRGDGGREAPQFLGPTIDTVAGGFGGGGGAGVLPSGDGGQATAARLGHARSLAFGPDGSLYVADSFAGQIRRVAPNGIISKVAGRDFLNGSSFQCFTPTAACGDGGPATQAELGSPTGIAVGPDNSLYIADNGIHRVRKVGPDGIINTIAGTGVRGSTGDGGPATQAQLDQPYTIVLGADGSIYVTSGAVIRRIGPDGIITTYAGGAPPTAPIGDGGPATQARLGGPGGMAMGRDGSLYFADVGNSRVRRIGPDGIIRTIAGTGVSDFSGDGGPATQARFFFPTGVAVGLDDSVYVVDTSNNRIRWFRPGGPVETLAGNGVATTRGDAGLAVRASLQSLQLGIAASPDGSVYFSQLENGTGNGGVVRRISPIGERFVGGELAVPARDGSEIYMFTPGGLHLRTLDALTGALRYQFAYNGAGCLASVTGGDGNITTIERNAEGQPVAITGPFGQRTILDLDDHGYLSRVTNPAGEAVELAHTAGGLLAAVMRPGGQVSMYDYDDFGRLMAATDPTGARKTLSRAGTIQDYTVTLTSPLGKATAYRVVRSKNGDTRLTTTDCEGGQSQSLIGHDGHQSNVDADGTTMSLDLGPDPRWGMRVPIAASMTVTTPGGLSITTTAQRSVTLAGPGQLLNLSTLTDSVTTNGRTWTSAYDGPTRTLVSTSPAGRTGSIVFDIKGRPVQGRLGSLEPIAGTYDTRGRILTVAQGQGGAARVVSLTYGPNSYLSSATDPLGRLVTFTSDAAGRVTKQILPGDRAVSFAYDSNGNIRGITPPGRPEHTFTYNLRDDVAAYTPPAVGAEAGETRFAYDADRKSTRIDHPDGGAVQFRYAGGTCQLNVVDLGARQRTYGYDAAGRLTSLGASQGISLSHTYDGEMPMGATWSGAIAGSVVHEYDTNLRVTNIRVNGTDPVAILYDADDLPVKVGGFDLTRSPANGLITATALGAVSDTTTYDGFGAQVGYTASYNGTVVYATSYTRDLLGRISQQTETLGGVTRVIDYTYDLAGRLSEVRHDGALSGSYTYDSNGNRLSRTDAGGTINGTYDARDRLIDFGPTTYSHNPRGERVSKLAGGQTTVYQYEGMGNLMGVTLSDGTQIEYLLDAQDRRVGRRVNGTLVQAFLYQDGLRPIAELDGAGAVVGRFIFATGRNVPDYTVKGGVTCRIITDHLGSPRLVIDIATGQIVQRMEHDDFGRVTLDTNPGFQPFGFAGGLYDVQTGLVHFGAREYDPETGRWTIKDPIQFSGGDGNLYAYAGNDSVNNIDPGGLCFSTLCGCAQQPGVCAAAGIFGQRVAPHAQRVLAAVSRIAAAAPKSNILCRLSTLPGIGPALTRASQTVDSIVSKPLSYAAVRAADLAAKGIQNWRAAQAVVNSDNWFWKTLQASSNWLDTLPLAERYEAIRSIHLAAKIVFGE